MDTSAVGLIILCILIFVSFYFKQVWLSIIFAVVFLACLAVTVKPKPKPVPKGPAVRPIIVKRKYVGPESIYPEKIDITADWEGTPDEWREYGPAPVGKAIGTGIRRLLGFGKKK